mgnify:CR=1 FL=1
MQQVEGGAPPAASHLVDELQTEPITEEIRSSSNQVDKIRRGKMGFL